ncbi:MAG: hypothetical protein HOI53_02110 [Francisellaceae bacterium]|jgi:transcriptional regulator of arginine metabolism|nr:hypothetical protein [Francisellaceae bacterium]MBT6206798.1 hypothetical protein [Francisellaceae bacterium]MBT6539508.1 hypothetical protein [Francisellaceae bacterium]
MKFSDDDLIEIISSRAVHDQQELSQILANEGSELTQASLSRRLKKLNIRKIDGIYKQDILNRSYSSNIQVISIKSAQPNIIVLKTPPGGANSVAYVLDTIIDNISDHPDFTGILGTVAGDDTIMVVVTDPIAIISIQKAIEEKFCN